MDEEHEELSERAGLTTAEHVCWRNLIETGDFGDVPERVWRGMAGKVLPVLFDEARRARARSGYDPQGMNDPSPEEGTMEDPKTPDELDQQPIEQQTGTGTSEAEEGDHGEVLREQDVTAGDALNDREL